MSFWRNKEKTNRSDVAFGLLAMLSGTAVGFGFLFLWSSAKEGHGIGLEVALLVLAIIAAFGIFAWKVSRTPNGAAAKAGLVHAALAFIGLVAIVWFVIFTPWKREVRIEFSNPLLYGGESYVRAADVFFFQPKFWLPGSLLRDRLTEVYGQREKDARLIKFSDPRFMGEVIGLNRNLVVDAFGGPDSVRTEGDYEVWIYHPWKSYPKWKFGSLLNLAYHPDWEMPVYMSGLTLKSIGSLESLSKVVPECARSAVSRDDFLAVMRQHGLGEVLTVKYATSEATYPWQIVRTVRSGDSQNVAVVFGEQQGDSCMDTVPRGFFVLNGSQHFEENFFTVSGAREHLYLGRVFWDGPDTVRYEVVTADEGGISSRWEDFTVRLR